MDGGDQGLVLLQQRRGQARAHARIADRVARRAQHLDHHRHRRHRRQEALTSSHVASQMACQPGRRRQPVLQRAGPGRQGGEGDHGEARLEPEGGFEARGCHRHPSRQRAEHRPDPPQTAHHRHHPAAVGGWRHLGGVGETGQLPDRRGGSHQDHQQREHPRIRPGTDAGGRQYQRPRSYQHRRLLAEPGHQDSGGHVEEQVPEGPGRHHRSRRRHRQPQFEGE